jgi:hypothetical protein
MTITSGDNVLIGTTIDAGYKLDVNGTFRSNALWTNASSIAFWGFGTTAYGGLTWDTGYATVYATAGNALNLGSNGASPDVTINLSGNVGIGTISPVSRLQSNNVSTYNSATPSGAIVASNLSNGDAVLDIGVDSTSLGYIQSRNINSTTVYNLLLNPIGGNVGIGTTNPGAKLEVASPSSGTTMLVGRANGNSSIKALPSEGGYLALDSSGIATIINHYSSDNVWLATGGGNVLVGAVSSNGSKLQVKGSGATSATTALRVENSNASASMVVLDNGNVGIGTTTPTRKLEVTSGDILIDNDRGYFAKNTGGSALTLLQLDTSNNCLIGSPYQGGTTNIYSTTNILFYSYPSSVLTETMRIMGSTGNVLIGTAIDAGYKLQVSGSTRVVGDVLVSNGNTNVIYGNLSDYSYVRAYWGNTFANAANTNGIMTVGNSVTSTNVSIGSSYAQIGGGPANGLMVQGDVGIGTTSPTSILDTVVSNGAKSGIRFRGYSDASTPYLLSLGTYTYSDIFQITSVNGLVSLNNTSLYDLALGTNNTERLRITSTGNVLIRTNVDSGYTLNVNGTGYFNGNVKVNGAIQASTPTASSYICHIGLTADQVLVSGADAVLDFVDIADTNNWYDPTTKRFLPNVAGYYHIDFSLWFEPSPVSTGQYNIQVRKNGTTVMIIQQPTINNGTGQSLMSSKLVYFNGTTDYIDFTAYQSTGSNRNIWKGTDSSGTYATIHLLAV